MKPQSHHENQSTLPNIQYGYARLRDIVLIRADVRYRLAVTPGSHTNVQPLEKSNCVTSSRTDVEAQCEG